MRLDVGFFASACRARKLCPSSSSSSEILATTAIAYRTLILRDHDPIATLVQALRTYMQTGQLPLLPQHIVGDG